MCNLSTLHAESIDLYLTLDYRFLIIFFISEKLFWSNLLFFADVIKARSAKIKARRLNVSIIERAI